VQKLATTADITPASSLARRVAGRINRNRQSLQDATSCRDSDHEELKIIEHDWQRLRVNKNGCAWRSLGSACDITSSLEFTSERHSLRLPAPATGLKNKNDDRRSRQFRLPTGRFLFDLVSGLNDSIKRA